MAAPSKNFTSIADGAVDADSPLDTTLVTNLRDNDIHLEEWLGKNYTAAVDHDHDGTNSKLITSVADGAIVQTKLSTAIGGESTTSTSWDSRVMPGGEYGFYPQMKTDGTAYGNWSIGQSLTGLAAWQTRQSFKKESGSGTIYMQHRYIQASPPYKIGAATWGHFLWLLRNIGTGDIIGASHAEDPPWAYNGLIYLPKDHPDRITGIPHPFANYFDKDPATDGLEIVLVNLSGIDVVKWRGDNEKMGKSILEDLSSVLTGKGTDKAWSDYTVPIIPKFTDKVKVITP